MASAKKRKAALRERGLSARKGLGLAEQRQQGLAVAVGDRQRLDTELLLDLEGLQTGRLSVHVGVDQLTDTAGHRVHQRLHEVAVVLDAVLDGAEVGGSAA